MQFDKMNKIVRKKDYENRLCESVDKLWLT